MGTDRWPSLGSTGWEAIAAARFGLPRRPAERDLRTADFVGWLADHSSHSFQEIYAAVSTMVARIEASPPSIRHGDIHARRSTTRAEIAEATARYYDEPGPGVFYRADVAGADLRLTILTSPNWLTVVKVGADQERTHFLPTSAPAPHLDGFAMEAAARCLAAVELTDTVLVNNPLYRLVDIQVGPASLAASFDLTSFAEYALTSDLLEEELAGTLLTPGKAQLDDPREAMPLRATYLPSKVSALAVGDRTYVGGAVALTAIARRPRIGKSDYLLLIQERSNAVLNVTGRLAVIPKAFHQPVGEPAGEVAVSTTLERELEEELLGRDDLDQLASASGSRHVAPMHRHRASEPLAWLLDQQASGAYRTECTGFGLNMVTGNYEFACLIVIDDESWWDDFGHLVESNWEASACIASRRSTPPVCRSWPPIPGGATKVSSPSCRASAISPTLSGASQLRPSTWRSNGFQLAQGQCHSRRCRVQRLACRPFHRRKR